MVFACVGNTGKERSLLNQTSLLLHQTTFQTSSNRNIYGTTTAVRASLLRGVVYFQTERTTSHGLGLNAYQIVNTLRSSVASCMFQTWKHITPWYDQSLYPYPNTCQNHASENTIFSRPRGWTAVGVSETEKNQTRKTVLTHLQHISSSTRTDE